jgi:hypothetical protein
MNIIFKATNLNLLFHQRLEKSVTAIALVQRHSQRKTPMGRDFALLQIFKAKTI